MDLTVDVVIDNGDNSLTIIGDDGQGNTYSTSMGRKSDVPSNPTKAQAYYLQVLQATFPPTPTVVYQAPNFTPDDTQVSDFPVLATLTAEAIATPPITETLS